MIISKKPKNIREAIIYDQYLKDGWEVYHKGFPDFLMYKDGKIKMIEVKRQQKRKTIQMGLSKYQQRIKEILSQFFDYEIVYIP